MKSCARGWVAVLLLGVAGTALVAEPPARPAGPPPAGFGLGPGPIRDDVPRIRIYENTPGVVPGNETELDPTEPTLDIYLPPPDHYPTTLLDAQRALRLIKSRAREFGVDPDRVGVFGGSAGGHLAALVSTLYAALSPQLHVTQDTPPAFLVHGTNDRLVPVKNALLYYEACVAAGVPAEMHLLDDGPHGFGLGLLMADATVKAWPAQALHFMARQRMIPPLPPGGVAPPTPGVSP